MDTVQHKTTRQNYDRLSRWYDLFSASERRFSAAGLRLLDVQPGERVLEIGPGTGHALAELARTGDAHGLDLSPGMLRVAERHLRRLGLMDRVRLQQGDATRLPYPDGHFQALFLSFTLELFPDDEMPRVLAECRRVLQAGGRLGAVSLVKKDAAAVKIYEWFHARLPDVVDCRPILVRPLLEAAGFEVQEMVEETIWGLPAEAVLAVRV
jgi:demethylmenaquinone methyltransferase/2-methoxy-6-polyprenyl-1,4-benzoquinol methylase